MTDQGDYDVSSRRPSRGPHPREVGGYQPLEKAVRVSQLSKHKREHNKLEDALKKRHASLKTIDLSTQEKPERATAEYQAEKTVDHQYKSTTYERFDAWLVKASGRAKANKKTLRYITTEDEAFTRVVILKLFEDDEVATILLDFITSHSMELCDDEGMLQRSIELLASSLIHQTENKLVRRVATTAQTSSFSLGIARELSLPVSSRKLGALDTVEIYGRHVADSRSYVIEEEENDKTTADVAESLAVIHNSISFLHCKRELLNMVFEDYEQGVMFALADSLMNNTDKHARLTQRVARELSWVPDHLFTFSDDRSLSMIDRMKGYVEDIMDEKWNWSPLRPRRHRLRAGFWRLSWKSPRGDERYVDLPERDKVFLQHEIDSAPNFVNRTNWWTTSAGGSATTASTNSISPLPSSSSQAAGATSSSLPTGLNVPMQSFRTPAPVATSNLQPLVPVIPNRQTSHHVYLCVESGSRRFVDMDCSALQTDVQFFASIKAEYIKARGWFRIWFSTWCYDHCEFFRFQKTGIGLGARLKIAFPEISDQLYDYTPRPPKDLPPDGPISHDEFREHYYHEVCPSLLSWERWHRRQVGLSTVDKEALEAVPKRVVKLDMQNGKREHFYGLYAKEARSALRVALHLLLCNVPGVVFFFLWLFQWKHGSDLQGAAVPVQLSLSLTIGYLGVLYWTR